MFNTLNRVLKNKSGMVTLDNNVGNIGLYDYNSLGRCRVEITCLWSKQTGFLYDTYISYFYAIQCK